jgi:RimJ/RimL family protein N-acetyltransferase
MNDANIYEGERVRLSALDPVKDPDIEAVWSHSPDFLALFSTDLQRPVSAHQLRKRYEEREKNREDDAYEFELRIRLRADDRLIGLLRIWAEWSAGNAWLQLGIGSPGDRRQGYGRDALRLALRYIFDEMNLRRVSLGVPGYNEAALTFFAASGFQVEARQREALYRFGRRWDQVNLGLLRAEWEATR